MVGQKKKNTKSANCHSIHHPPCVYVHKKCTIIAAKTALHTQALHLRGGEEEKKTCQREMGGGGGAGSEMRGKSRE